MKSSIFSVKPDYTPVVRMMAMQTRFAIETSQGMMKLAMLPWTGLPKGFGAVVATTGIASDEPEAAVSPAVDAAVPADVAPVEKAVVAAIKETSADVAPVEAPVVVPISPPVAKITKAATPAAQEPAVKTETVKTETVKSALELAPVAPTPIADAPVAKPEPAVEAAPTTKPALVADAPVVAAEPKMAKPMVMAAPADGGDDLTALNGVGPKLAEALNAEGIYTLAQIANWTEANVLWIDENLPGVRGRASRNGWVAQAAELAE